MNPAGSRISPLRRLVLGLLGTIGLLAWQSAMAQPAARAPTPLDYFGLTDTGATAWEKWPSVPFGSVRLWDSYVTWPYLEPVRGQWRFEALDKQVAAANSKAANVMLVLAHSPPWASARPSEKSAFKPGFAAEPVALKDWQEYVTAVATRYKGKIHEYQVWNEPSDRSHFTGTVEKLVELTCSVHRIVKRIDPKVRVVSAGSAGGQKHIQYLEDFLKAGGEKCIDIVAHHFYVPRFGPEAMVPLIREVKAVMQRRGLQHMPLWNTETGWWIGRADGGAEPDMVAKGGWRMLDPDLEAGAVIQRAFLLARAEGVDRFYWYAWNNRYGWGLVSEAGDPKPAARYWPRAVDLLTGHVLHGCEVKGAAAECMMASGGQDPKRIGWTDPQALSRREGPSADRASIKALPEAIAN